MKLDGSQHVPSSRPTALFSLALVSLLTLTGCSGIKVRLGMRVSLPKIPVSSMEASLSRETAMAPGETSPLIVTFAGPNGQVLPTEGAGKGKVQWKDLNIVASVVSVNKKGVVSLPRDPRVSEGKTGHLVITIPSQPGREADLDIPLRYDYAFVSRYLGAAGSDGLNGTDGSSGVNGSPGSMDPNNPSPGGDGTNGTDGSNGGDGGDGADGPPVH